MKRILQMLAGYNQWANRRLYAAVGDLSDADYRADQGRHLRSTARNHLVVAADLDAPAHGRRAGTPSSAPSDF